MNTPEIVKQVAVRLDLTQRESKRLLKKSIKVLKMILAHKTGVSIPDLGTFTTHVREPRKSFIPYYRTFMILPPKRVVHFQPSLGLKEEVRELTVEENHG